MKHHLYLLLIFFLMTVSQVACVKEPSEQPLLQGQPLLAILKNNYNFSMFYNSLLRTGMDKLLEGSSQMTLLVPDNNAFAASGISNDSLAKMDTATLGKLVRYHMIPGKTDYKSIPQTINFPFQTVAGLPVYVSIPIPGPNQVQSVTSNILHVNGVNVGKTNLTGANGIIHVLDRVLYYPAGTVQEILEKDPQYSYFVQGLKAFGLWEQLAKPNKFTILAPSNDLFEQNGLDGSQLDPNMYASRLLTPYILPQQYFFITDMKDAPFGRGGLPGILTPEFILVLDCYNVNYGIWPFNYETIQNLVAPPYWGDAYIYGPAVTFVNTDHQAQNGVVHGLTGLVMRPDSALINR